MSNVDSVWDTVKSVLTKTSLANLASFVLVIGMMVYGMKVGDRDIIITAGSAGIGYLFGSRSTA